MVAIKESRMEVMFGFFGALFILIMLPITVLLSPDYSPITLPISSLGDHHAKTLFSIAFVVAGSLSIPFYIYLKNELVYLEDRLRKIATGVAIFSNMCIALVGILPAQKPFLDAFGAFHAFVAIVSFSGSSLYIVLYSLLMYLGPKSPMYKGPEFKKYLAYYGFSIGIVMTIYIFTGFKPFLEWIVVILILVWVLITARQCLSFKFSKIPGIYYKPSQYPEKLKLFEDAIQVLENLEIVDEPMLETLKENVEFIKNEMEKNQKKSSHK